MLGDILATNAWSVTLSWVFLRLSVLKNDTDKIMTNSDCSKLMSASRALLWWSEVRLKQLLRPSHAWWHFVQPALGHLVETFSVGDNHDSQSVPSNKISMYSCSVWPDRPSKQIEREIMLILLLGTDHTTRQVYSNNVVIISDRKSRNQVSGQDVKCHLACDWPTNC